MSLFYAKKIVEKVSESQKFDEQANETKEGSSHRNGKKGERRINIANAPQDEDFSSINIPSYDKSEESTDFLIEALSSHYLFETLDEEDLLIVVGAMQGEEKHFGETVIEQGDIGDLFYVLEEGRCECFVNQTMVCDYGPGGCFGELSLIYNDKRAASILVASSKAHLWTLDFNSFRLILASTNSSKMADKCEFLKEVPLFEPLSNDHISKIAAAMKQVSFPEGHYIIHQGDVGDDFYIIKSGHVKCTQYKGADDKEVYLITLSQGEHFGEMALLLDEPRHANCIAEGGDVICYSLDRSHFTSLLGSLQALIAERMRIRVLQSVPLLASLPENTLLELGNRMRVQGFDDGEYIIRQGEEGSRFYIINEGEVVCTLTNQATREEKELVHLYPQEYFGERALIKKEPRKANVIAIGDVECLVLESDDFQELLSSVHQEVEDIIENREKTREELMKGNNKKKKGNNDNDDEIKEKEEEEEKKKKESDTFNEKNRLDSIPFDELNVLHTIGTGTFGRVKLVQHKGSGRVCALKYMMKAQITEARQERNVLYEKNLLIESSDHPFILSLITTYNTVDEIMLLFEFIQGGELWSYIYDREDCIPTGSFGGFSEEATVFYGAIVAEALSHIHSLGIAYRDLKPENLMMDQMGYLKVIDFGFAKKIPHYMNGTLYRKSFTVCGTPEYLSPELVLSKGHDKSVDHWALGCLIYELLVGTTPFADDRQQNTFRKIVNCKKYLAFPEGVSRQFKDICTSLLEPEPSFRLGSLNGGNQDIKSHPFFHSIDWDALISKTIEVPYRPFIENPLDTSNFDYFDDEDDVTPYYGDQSIFTDF